LKKTKVGIEFTAGTLLLSAFFHFRGRAAQKGPAPGNEPCAPTGMHSLCGVHRFLFKIVLVRRDGVQSLGFDALA